MRHPIITGACALLSAFAMAAANQPLIAATASVLASTKTEEGQIVIYDGYTWQRRELAKRLPLAEPWPSEAKIEAQFRRFDLNKPPMAADIPVPAKIMEDIYVVNSKPNLTYLIDAGPDGLVIVDPGLPSNVESILRNVEALGFPRKSIRWVINTHAHFDHSMADADFQKLGAKIYVGREDVGAVEKGTQITAKFVLPADQVARYPTLRVDHAVDDGEELVLGNKTFFAIHTPGHTYGSTCYSLEIAGKKILFGGDTVLFDYRLGAQSSPYADDVAYLASFKKLARFDPYFHWDVLLPGHGTIVLDRAFLDILKGERQVQLDVGNGEQVAALPFGTAAYRRMMFGRP